MNDRFKKSYRRLESVPADAFLISNPLNVRYLTGFSGTFAFLLVLAGRRILFTDSRYYGRAVDEASDVSVVLIDNNWPDILLKYKIKCLAFESDTVSYTIFSNWKKRLKGIKLVPAEGIVEKVREVKSSDEISKIKRAISIIDEIMSGLVFRRGMSEEQLVIEVEKKMRIGFGVNPSFDIIAAFGSNSSIPHALPGRKKLCSGQAVVLDAGVVYDGYSSDLTRTFWTGRITRKFEEIYNIVLTAQRLAIEGVKPGRPVSEIDLLARDYIKERGYGGYFGHSLGHGIGLSVHELPRISFKSKGKLEKGMVFSVEPGIYLPGWGGVRIEDLVLVTDTGCEVLSKSPKELGEIVIK